MQDKPTNDKEITSRKTKTTSRDKHFIVAIGASAGGLEAIHEFFDNTPDNSRLSFVVVQHLSPDYKSLLVELVSKHTHMKVFEAKQDMTVQPDCVYVIPNNKVMRVEGGKLRLAEKVFSNVPNTAIDIFFSSLAKDAGSKSVAVILSGTGTDGTRGIEAIKGAGGIVLVQDPSSAKFDGMPNSAIASGNADFVLPPGAMPGEIYTYIQETPVHILQKGRIDEQLLGRIFKEIYEHTGYDFKYYKAPTIIRRIGRRMMQLEKERLEEYVDYLERNAEEARILCKDFLIGVTRFFRDQPVYDLLKDEVLPDILDKKQSGDVVKVWICACSTGEEVYSVAMLIDSYLQATNKILDVKIFATDIDNSAIEVAHKGRYPVSIENDVSADMLDKYFVKEGDQYVIIPRIRKQIIFARHDIIKDPPFIRNDLICCRNMLIYMNHILQKKALATFHFALSSHRYLLLGTSETTSVLKDYFEEVNGKWKIYRRMDKDSVLAAMPLYSNHDLAPGHTTKELPAYSAPYLSGKKKQVDIADDFRDILSEEFGYAALYVDKSFEVRDAVGQFKRYISLPEKKLNMNLFKVVSTDLSVALNTAIRKAVKESVKVSMRHVKVQDAGVVRYLNIVIKPPADKQEFITVVLGESASDSFQNMDTFQLAASASEPNGEYILELESELKDARENLQLTLENFETANEELQSSNEELLSANEELQSSNEELQSLNEELHTLNTEHQLKIKELIDLNDDLNNYFRSIDIGQLFLDANLNIRRFNPAAVKQINLIETDIGRPISHISTNIRSENLLEDLRRSLNRNVVVEKEVLLSSGRTSLMRIMPYVRQDKKTDGLVITFVDVSAIKDLNNVIKGVFNASHSAIMVFQSVRNTGHSIVDFTLQAMNHTAARFIGKKDEDASGKLLRKEHENLVAGGLFEKYIQVVQFDELYSTELYLEEEAQRGWYGLVAVKMMDGMVLTLTDITEKKESEERLKRSYNELMVARESLKKLNTELEEKVTERTRKLSESEERFRLVSRATNDAIWDWNLVTNEVWWNDSFYGMFGYKAGSETVTRNFWLENIHPEDRERVRNGVHNAVNSSSEQWMEEYRFKKADGTYAHLLDRGYLLKDEYGTPYRMLGSMMDMSDLLDIDRQLKQTDRQLRTAMQEFTFITDFIPQIIWSAQPDGTYDFFNREWYAFTGVPQQEDSLDTWKAVIHPDDYERTRQIRHRSLETGDTYEVEYRLRRHDGEYRWFLGRAMSFKDDQGNIIKWFGICTDIHDQKLQNESLEKRVQDRTHELQHINQELEASNLELQQFAFVASHDLKEPLRKIHIFSSMIRDKYLEQADDRAADFMERIISSTARMTKLVNDLLSFSRLSVTQLYEVSDINQIIDEIRADLEVVINEKHAQFDISPIPTLEVVPGQMRQVFQNLISNALKFSKKNEPPVVRIQAERIAEKRFESKPDAKGPYCRIVIRDNGIGFDEQYINKIFILFQRLHTREQYEGTGIGLAITKKIIEKHNGLITATSQENEGATFVIILPLQQTAK